jgi:hypothetical protein
VAGDRVVPLVLSGKGLAQPVEYAGFAVALAEIAEERECLLVVRHSVHEPAQHDVRVAQIVQRGRLATVMLQVAEDGQRPTVVLDRGRGAAESHIHAAEVRQRIGLANPVAELHEAVKRLFGPAAGLLMYAGAVAERLGATVHRHSWSQEPPEPFDLRVEGWVCGEAARVLDEVGGSPLLIAKSLGTNAAALAAERSLPAVWLTPLLTVPWVAAALDHATAPFLLVGGTADEFWDGAVARRLSPYVLEVEGADHGMYVPGPVSGSVAVLGRVVVAVEEFLDAIDWPG